MFIDRRNRPVVGSGANGDDGQYLVVCSEGNAGFYEIGCMSTPIESDYSVLGWNHPGFAGSSGTPFPAQEQHAIDAVMQYATHRLGFPEDKIILFAWSIGGYTTAFAALNYSRVRGVILGELSLWLKNEYYARMIECTHDVKTQWSTLSLVQ